MLYKGKLDQIIMCLYVEVICKIQTMYVTNLRSGLEYIVKEQNDLAKDYYKKIAQPGESEAIFDRVSYCHLLSLRI